MKKITLLLAITLLPFTTYADEFDTQINKACLRHAVSLVARLKSDVVELSNEKSDQALILATESCQAYFKKEFSQNKETVAAAKEKQKEEEDDDDKDWFTEMMTSGESGKKAGNKRLERKN